MSTRRRLARALLTVGAAAAVLVIVWIGLLAYPRVLCPHRVRSGAVVLYFDDMPRAEAETLVQAVDHRLTGSGFYDPARTMRAFVFQSPARYALVTRLAAVPGEAQGFNLSALGNTFVSAPRVAALGARSGGGPKYSVWEGDLSHTVAHELAHQILVDRMGRLDLPPWKREGLAEYVANIGLMRLDPTSSLTARLSVYQDHRAWRATSGWERQGWDRTHYESGLLVEYLIDIRHYRPEDIVADSVTADETRTALRAWADAQYAPGPPH